MAYQSQAGPSSENYRHPQRHQEAFADYDEPPNGDRDEEGSVFNTLDWYKHFLSCQEHFLEKGQHDYAVQAIAAFINIQLPFQKQPYPVNRADQAWSRKNLAERPSERRDREWDGDAAHQGHPAYQQQHGSPSRSRQGKEPGYPQHVSLIPYLRRLIITSHDSDEILEYFFGVNWRKGLGALHEVERRNYMFASKSKNWLDVKTAYDISPEQSVPFLTPLREVLEVELKASDDAWSQWMAMGDWMLGPREPPELQNRSRSPRVKVEMDGEMDGVL
ncbi:ilp is an apoptosis inhibitor protein [Rutstroemia sp. NJR-2017a BVV2]|nr:ilp is an apoptosis inhibitor protein [Rutstroemia sp. NJR-2017a BVV2]